MSATNSQTDLKPLKITCTSTKCEDNLHCFRQSGRIAKTTGSSGGKCRSCGAQLVNWDRVHQRNLNDVGYTIEALKYELIRHYFWHIPLSEYAINYARRKGKVALRIAVQKQIRNAVANPDHPLQGRQTPRETSPHATVVHYSQHATASCCRRCLEEWHGIPMNEHLNEEQIEYLTDLSMRYIEGRLPDLNEQPVQVPRRGPRQAATQEALRLELPHAG